MELKKAIKNLTEKFTSKNSHPVIRSNITSEEWNAIRHLLQPMQTAYVVKNKDGSFIGHCFYEERAMAQRICCEQYGQTTKQIEYREVPLDKERGKS